MSLLRRPDSVAALFSDLMPPQQTLASSLRRKLTQACRLPEENAVAALLSERPAADPTRAAARELARELIIRLRRERSHASGVDALMHAFSLSSGEGVALMCLAEALLRIPDNATRDRLIADKIGRGDWRSHLGSSPSLFVNAAAWGLLVTGKLVSTHSETGLRASLNRLLAKGGEPLVRAGVDFAMRLLGQRFVCGQTIAEALANSRDPQSRGYQHSYDMLGEAALTMDDALAYTRAYEEAIHAIGQAAQGSGVRHRPGISVKLSALHPRYTRSQQARVFDELLPRLRRLMLLAQQYDIGLNIDAEEADRLELSLDLLERLALDPALAGFSGMGFVVQAYQKRAPFVLDWVADLARRSGQRFMLRLVKGAYWDAEIKRAQVDGLEDYPVFTRKSHTDLSYLVCARKLLANPDAFYPQFATHNAHTLATIHHWALAAGVDDLEFQCLHGMGESLYDQVVGQDGLGRRCRIYAPVGSHRTLLAYLVRRLLENGANSSFVNRIVDETVPVEDLLADPFDAAVKSGGQPHPAIALPADLFAPARPNSSGLDLASDTTLADLASAIQTWSGHCWQVAPLTCHPQVAASGNRQGNPARNHDQVAEVRNASRDDVAQAARHAAQAGAQWQASGVTARADVLRRAADLLQQHRVELLALIVREAGRTLAAAMGEVREAIDFLRYYAQQAEQLGATQPLGTIACISPWNFPLAIFVGQVAAALATGNAVLAKPAEQTPATAWRATRLLHEAGVPPAVLQLLPGSGEEVGSALVDSALVGGVMFTGSTEVAALIQARLLARSAVEGRELPLIAETGGLNAMIVDSSALPEQVVQDALGSAFDSAGQRCSALRLLCLQEEIAEPVLHMLKGALQEWQVGPPDLLCSDCGPVIDTSAAGQLQVHVDAMAASGRAVFRLALPATLPAGSWFAPTIVELENAGELQREVFGPVLHVVRYRQEALPELLRQIAATGYGLTMGIHSRIDERIAAIIEQAPVGNIYVNRNMIGAVVGVQPFGGMGRSGTGPKAGGPRYLWRLVKTVPADSGQPQSDDAMQEWRLPGPTGESNQLREVARGPVLCLAADESLRKRMADLVRAAGNTVLLPDLSGPSSPEQLSRILQAGTPPVAMILADRHALDWLARLPFPDGMPLVLPVLDGQLPAHWLMRAEQTVTVNTAAAGGNATLMSLGD